jgi:hypothetical protein
MVEIIDVVPLLIASQICLDRLFPVIALLPETLYDNV